MGCLGFSLQRVGSAALTWFWSTEKPDAFGVSDLGGHRLLLWDLFLKGSKDPNNRVLEHNCYSINGISALKPYYLGPRTL